ncbi:MAG: hypothetical protein DCC71_16650 [Proteobacteria bacterium]|nr:MAG: hypothetical protein DCC71_16650 [Pseudomonadota bacterium]
MNEIQVRELLLQAVETERAGVEVYETAIECAQNELLRAEWVEYRDQTKRHEEVLRDLCETLGIDPESETAGRAVVRLLGNGLVAAMRKAADQGSPEVAQLVAAECVVLAETKDHLNWELIEEIERETTDETRRAALRAAFDAVEEDEDRHLYHTEGWTRELWLESLGLPCVIPPPEETDDVTTAIEAARVRQQRDDHVA